MNPRVEKVLPLNNYLLHLTFKNNEEKIFDVKPWLEKEVFSQLRNLSLFNKVYVSFGTVSWNDEIDFCPDTLYLESKKIEKT